MSIHLLKLSSVFLVAVALAALAPFTADAASGNDKRPSKNTKCENKKKCVIKRGDDLAALVNSAQPGTKFKILRGVHRPKSFDSSFTNEWLVPKDNQVFECQRGAVLNGAQVIEGPWVQDDENPSLYYSDSVPAPLNRFSCGFESCVVPKRPRQPRLRNNQIVDFPVNDYPEDLFINDRLYLRVGSKSEVNNASVRLDGEELWAGTFFQDVSTDPPDPNDPEPTARVYVAFDPSEALVELSRKTFAFRVTPMSDGQGINYVKDVKIEDCVVEKFASPAQLGAIQALFSEGWTLENLTVRHNHGVGLRAGADTTVEGGKYVHNGQLGINASSGPAGDFGGPTQQNALAENIKINAAEIARNNFAGFGFSYESGGIKVLKADGFEVTNSHIHHNIGNGIWSDSDVVRNNFANNYVHDNARMGILIEATDPCAVAGLCQPEVNRTEFVVNNRVEDNARVIDFDPTLRAAQDLSYWFGTEILLQNTANVLVRGNKVVNSNGQGIGVLFQAFRPYFTQFNAIVNNEIVIAVQGGVQDQGYSGGDNENCTVAALPDCRRILDFNRFAENVYTTAPGIDEKLGYWRFDTFSPFTWDDLPPGAEECSTFNTMPSPNSDSIACP